MPNHITNILVCDDYEALEYLLNEDGHVDFNIITPMPDCIKNTSVGKTVEYEDCSVENWEDRAKTRRPLTQQEILNGAGEGWYKWSLRNWGTKWNAYETKVLHHYILSFQTAWNPPIPVIKGLSEKFPNIEFYLHWKDEGADGDLNSITFKAGKAHQ